MFYDIQDNHLKPVDFNVIRLDEGREDGICRAIVKTGQDGTVLHKFQFDMKNMDVNEIIFEGIKLSREKGVRGLVKVDAVFFE